MQSSAKTVTQDVSLQIKLINSLLYSGEKMVYEYREENIEKTSYNCATVETLRPNLHPGCLSVQRNNCGARAGAQRQGEKPFCAK